MDEMTPDGPSVEVRVRPWIDPGTGGVLVPWELQAELRELLTESGIDQPPTVRDSGPGALHLVAFIVGNAAFWPSLAGVIKALVNRNKDKRVRIVVEAGRVTTDFDGFNHKQMESFMDVASQRFTEGERRWTSPEWLLAAPEPEEDNRADPGLDF
ncbi:hypothetical protein ABZS68_32535 [Streptomyces sp. NPDC005571]|uniref:hypothetical protein n=1 Tax=Streptomyces sp. NPDC005571 TaxID=3156888 RepID=UPI0033A7679A